MLLQLDELIWDIDETCQDFHIEAEFLPCKEGGCYYWLLMSIEVWSEEGPRKGEKRTDEPLIQKATEIAWANINLFDAHMIWQDENLTSEPEDMEER